MKTKVKRILSVLLCVVLTITMMAPGLSVYSAGITMEITRDNVVVTEKLTVEEYSTIQLGYSLSENMPEGAYVEWESNLPLLAGVDETGKVTGYDYSKAAVFQLWLDEEVRTIPVVGETTANAILLALETAGINLETADTATIVATIRAVAGDSIADSLQAALDNMNVQITATLYDLNGNKLASDTVEVLVEMNYIAYALPTGIHITNKRSVPTTVAVGKTLQLYGAYTPVRAFINSDFSWTSNNTSCATVDADGMVTFVGAGTVTIELGFSSIALFAYKDSMTFTVVDASVLPVTDFSIAGTTSVAEGATTQLAIDGLDPAGAYTGDLVWSSSDPTTAIVDQNGVVTGLDGGSGLTYSKTATISATIGGITRSVNVTVTRSLLGSDISGVEISGEAAIGIGSSTTYLSTVAPSRLNTNSDVIREWGLVHPVTGAKIYAKDMGTATDGISTINTSGVLTGLNNGVSVIFVDATYNSKTITDLYSVAVGAAITDFTISGNNSINEDDTTQLTVSGITPSDAVYDRIIWTSLTPDVASVDENGLVKGLDAGAGHSFINNPSRTATITATINGVSRSFNVTVNAKFGLLGYTGGQINGPDSIIVDLPYTFTSSHTPQRIGVYRQYWGTPYDNGQNPWNLNSSLSGPGNTTNQYVTVDSSTGVVKGVQAGSTSVWTYMSSNILNNSYQTLTKDIDVVELVPKSITLTSPTKYEYLEGATTLDLTGMVVKVSYDRNEVTQYYPEAVNWTEEQLTAEVTDYKVSAIDTTLLDKEQYIVVTVTRAGKEMRAIFPILVNSKQVDTIQITQYPQYQYLEGVTQLNLNNLRVTANYLNAFSERIYGYTVNSDEFNPTLLDVEQNITVTYTHAGRVATTTFPVIVYGIPVVSVTTTPADYSGDWTKDDVVFTLDATHQVDGIKYYYKTSSSGWTQLDGNTLTVDTNIEEIYYFKAVNGKKIEGTATVGYAVNIDKVAPMFELVRGVTRVTNKSYNVAININEIGEAGVKAVLVNGEDIEDQRKFTVSENGTYIVKVISANGLESVQELVVDNIDKTAPEITDIAIGAVNSGDFSGLSTDEYDLYFKGDVQISISATDTGVAGVNLIQYRFIDEDGSAGSWKKYDDGNKPIISGDFKGSIEARVTDKATNVSEISKSKTFVIDSTKPADVIVSATGSKGNYESDTWTSDNVEIKLSSTAFSNIYMYYYSTDGGNTWVEVDDDTIVVSAHGITNFQFKARSYSGLESDITPFVVKIDKIAPVVRVDIEGEFGRWTAEPIKFSFSIFEDAVSGITYYYSTDNGNTWIEITTGDEIVLVENSNATYIFKAVNGTGVESNPSDSYKVMIDTVAPTIQLTPEIADYTITPYDISYEVATGEAGLKSVEVNGVDITDDGKCTVSVNGNYVFVVTGNNGMSTTEVITIDNFDYDVPTITGISTGEPVKTIDGIKIYNSDVTVEIFVTDIGTSGINDIQFRILDEELNAITEWASYDKNNKPVVNGDFKGCVEAKVNDQAGNVSPTFISSLFMIDTTTPEIRIEADVTEPTNGDVMLMVSIIDEGVCGIDFISANGNVLDGNEYVATENGTYTFVVTLNNGNFVTETFTVSNIDREEPIITVVSVGAPEKTMNNVDIYGVAPNLTITAIDKGSSGIGKIEYNLGTEWIEYSSDNNPVIPDDFSRKVQVRVTDNAGNVSEIATSNNILVDTEKPTVAVAIDKEVVWETATVTYTLSGEADSGIAYYMVKEDDGPWAILDGTTYTTTEEGTHNYYFKSVSNSGVESEIIMSVLHEISASFSIKEPSRTTIRCKDSIVLHAEITGTLPEGTRIEWIANNEKFAVEESEDGMTFIITSQNNGNTIITAILYDADGNVLATDNIEMYSKAGFFDKIGGFFRSIFGATIRYND